MKKSKILAVIALVALTGFLWMACESGGSSSSSDSTSTESEFGNTKLPIPATVTPTVTYGKTQSVLIETAYDTDTIYVTTSGIFTAAWLPARVTFSFYDPLEILDTTGIVSRAGAVNGTGEIDIVQNSTAVAGQATVTVYIRSANNVVYTQEIKVLSMLENSINPADPLAVVKVSNLPTGVTYYDTDEVEGVWKDVKVTLTHPTFPAGFSLVVPLKDVDSTEQTYFGAGGATDIAAGTVTLAGVVSTEENGIPAISVIADKVSAIGVTQGSTLTAFEFRTLLDTTVPDTTNLAGLVLYADWDNPRNPDRTSVVGGKGRQGGLTFAQLKGLTNDTTATAANSTAVLQTGWNLTDNDNGGAYDITITFGNASGAPTTKTQVYKFTIKDDSLIIVNKTSLPATTSTAGLSAYATALSTPFTAGHMTVDYVCEGRPTKQSQGIGALLDKATDVAGYALEGSGSLTGTWNTNDVVTLYFKSVKGKSSQAHSEQNSFEVEKDS